MALNFPFKKSKSDLSDLEEKADPDYAFSQAIILLSPPSLFNMKVLAQMSTTTSNTKSSISENTYLLL